MSDQVGPFFGELYLRSTRPFLPDDVTNVEGDYLTRAFGRVEVPGPLLDVGCGHGRHLKSLRTQRLRVGIDFDPLSLAEARTHASVLRANFFKLPVGTARLAGAWCWYNTLFIFEEHEQVELLREIARTLKPGGLFVCQGLARQYIEARPHAAYDDYLPDGSRLIETSTYDPVTARDSAERRLITPDGRTMVAKYFIRYYFRDEMVALLEQAGLKVQWVHGAVDESPHGPESMDLIVGAQRG
ncbi:MAG: methyltransferase domain-containing protein [Myxococcaceae bacterium]|nr:methyltransferase domain-containing protein [Myxococcaceae bacterium]